MNNTDPFIDEIRRYREEHAARFNFDLWAIYEDLKEKQKKSGRIYYSLAPDGSLVPSKLDDGNLLSPLAVDSPPPNLANQP